MAASAALVHLESSTQGLTDAQARQRLERFGPNRLAEKAPRPAWLKFVDQFKNLLVLVLIGAAALASAIGDTKDAVVILIVVVLNAGLGFYQEHRAEATLAAGEGVVQRGPNPLYLHVAAAIATLESEAQALRSEQAELKSQIGAFELRQRRLLELQPDLQELERRREVAEKSVRSLSEREVEARTRSELVARGAGAVRLLEPARPPLKGESWKTPAGILALLIALAAAFAAGLARALSKRGFATPGAAERTLGLPVLAAIPDYRK